MQIFSGSSKIVVTCSNRLSPYLQQEIIDLGLSPQRTFKTGVELIGSMHDCIKLNLNLRCASQVLYSLHRFRANDADDVYKELLRFPWEDIFTPETFFSITSNVSNPTVNNPLFVNVRVKDAIVDRFREQFGKRPNSGAQLNGLVIHMYWKDDQAELFLDTSGETLSKHGYRKIPGKAPMLESLAASTVMATKWDKQSPFVNPMCGSGTLAIEAALLATNRTPGLFRTNYSFMHLRHFPMEMYAAERKKLDEIIIRDSKVKIVASDISEDAVNISKVNAGIAGVADMIDFSLCDFAETKIPETPGVIMFNPEYGDRLGEEIELQATYKRMGDFMKNNCKGYLGYIFTGNLELAKKIGLRPSRRIEFYTGKIDCRLFEYELYAGTRRKDV